MHLRSYKSGIAYVAMLTLSMGLQAATISQNVSTDDSGDKNYGQRFVVSSANFSVDQDLNSITFNKGELGGGSATLYMDIYAIGTANVATLDFSNNTETANLTYLGSSTNAIDYTALVGDANPPGDTMTWTFAGVTLPRDVSLFAVFSSNGVSGNYVGTSVNIINSGAAIFTNTTNADSDPLFGGDAESSSQDNFYSIEVTDIPEPGSLALLGLGGLLITARRRR